MLKIKGAKLLTKQQQQNVNGGDWVDDLCESVCATGVGGGSLPNSIANWACKCD